MTLEEWYDRAEKGTSGDMVYNILCDWDKDKRDYYGLTKSEPKGSGSNLSAQAYIVYPKGGYRIKLQDWLSKCFKNTEMKYCCSCGKQIEESIEREAV